MACEEAGRDICGTVGDRQGVIAASPVGATSASGGARYASCGTLLAGHCCHAAQRHAQTSDLAREVHVERVEHRFQSAYTVLLTASVAFYALIFDFTHRRLRRSWLVHAAAAVHYACFVFLIAVVIYDEPLRT